MSGSDVLVFVLIGVGGVGWLVYYMLTTPEQRTAARDAPARAKAAELNQQAQLVCPHCQTRGSVRSRREQRAKRKTATRIVGGIVTGGGSLLATGVSKKRWVTAMRCSNCGMTWDVD